MSPEYPQNWDTIRREIYQRDDYQCQNCGTKGGPGGQTELHVNHVVPLSQGGLKNKSNLVTLCEQCHNAAHGRGQAATAAGLSGSISWQANPEVGMDFDECEVCGSEDFGYEASDMVKCMNCDWVYHLEEPYITDAVKENFETCPGKGCISTNLEYKPFHFFSGKTALVKCHGGCRKWWRVNRVTGEYEHYPEPTRNSEWGRPQGDRNLRDGLLDFWNELKRGRS